MTGAGFKAGASVRLVLSPAAAGSTASAPVTSARAVRRTYDLGVVTTSATGAFSTTVRVPISITAAGPYHLIALSGFVTTSVGGACSVDPYQVLDIQTSAISPISATRAATSSSSGGTAFTGVDIAGLLAIGVLLLGAGVLFARRGRRPTARG